jgi:UDPglucose 6-dehydrogenase
MGDGGACHPRDNIALRYLAERLKLGYDLFDSIMKAREVQAERLAKACLAHGNNITIMGKAYKPDVPYTNGSSSMLVAHYINEHGGQVRYYDVNTDDTEVDSEWTEVFLIGYWDQYIEQFPFPEQATVIDPWRRIERTSAKIIHYGNTRKV